VLYLDHLSHLYYIMSDDKHHVNAKTRQYTMAVTFVFECVILSKTFIRNVTKWQDNKNQ